MRYQPFGWTEVRETGLGLAVPRAEPPCELTDEHLELARDDIAIPIYITSFVRFWKIADLQGSYIRAHFVYVDARNGRGIAIGNNYESRFSMYTSLMVSVRLAKWDSVRVWGSESGVVGSIFTRLDEPPKFEFDGRLVLLQYNDEWLLGSYDRFLHVLRTENDGEPGWFRVSGDVLVPLKKAHFLPGPPFGSQIPSSRTIGSLERGALGGSFLGSSGGEVARSKDVYDSLLAPELSGRSTVTLLDEPIELVGVGYATRESHLLDRGHRPGQQAVCDLGPAILDVL